MEKKTSAHRENSILIYKCMKGVIYLDI